MNLLNIIFLKKDASRLLVLAASIASLVGAGTVVGCTSIDNQMRLPSQSLMPPATSSVKNAVELAALLASYRTAAESPIRTQDDRRSDASRNPVDFLKFAGVMPSMKVMDIAASAGNTTQLMALVVGESGVVYAQGSQLRPALLKRLGDHPQLNIRPLSSPFDMPVSSDMPKLDLITINLNYHDIANLSVDRIKMNRALYDALKPGGHVVVIDHAAVSGSGARDTATLHRIDEKLVRTEFERVGFLVEESGDYLRNPADSHQEKSSSMEGSSDRFVLRFVRPGM
jgi:predicted methyltransferase